MFIFKLSHSCFPVMKLFHIKSDRNVTCKKKYEGLDRGGSAWKKFVAADVVPDFPLSNVNDLRKLTLRSNEFCMTQYYILEIGDSIFLLVMVFLD